MTKEEIIEEIFKLPPKEKQNVSVCLERKTENPQLNNNDLIQINDVAEFK